LLRRLLSINLLLVLLMSLITSITTVYAEDDSIEALGFTEKQKEKSSFNSLLPHPASLIAENITIITSDDISRLNAHTLDEVLQTVSGIQLFQVRTPGSTALLTLSGSLSNNITLLIDGVPQNLLGTSFFAEAGMIQVQRIERVEVIKGAASVTWGSALGGVINVITKDTNPEKKYSGTASTSIGEGTTSNLAGGISGKVSRFGYYLDGGGFHSNGLLPDNHVTLNHFFGKLTYDLPVKGRLTFSADFREGDRAEGDDKAKGISAINSASRYESTNLRFEYPLQQQLNLELFTSIGQKNAWQSSK